MAVVDVAIPPDVQLKVNVVSAVIAEDADGTVAGTVLVLAGLIVPPLYVTLHELASAPGALQLRYALLPEVTNAAADVPTLQLVLALLQAVSDNPASPTVTVVLVDISAPSACVVQVSV
jgi:hypothetical protein